MTLAAPDAWEIFKIRDPRHYTFGFAITPKHDITWFSTETDGNDLRNTLVFSDTIDEPTGDPNYAVTGYIDLDTDQNQATGKPLDLLFTRYWYNNGKERLSKSISWDRAENGSKC